MKEFLQLILFISIPSLILLVYIRQYVDLASMERKINKLSFKKKELKSRNHALKETMSKLTKNTNSRYWKSYQYFAPHEKNKVLRIKLPPRNLPKK